MLPVWIYKYCGGKFFALKFDYDFCRYDFVWYSTNSRNIVWLQLYHMEGTLHIAQC